MAMFCLSGVPLPCPRAREANAAHFDWAHVGPGKYEIVALGKSRVGPHHEIRTRFKSSSKDCAGGPASIRLESRVRYPVRSIRGRTTGIRISVQAPDPEGTFETSRDIRQRRTELGDASFLLPRMQVCGAAPGKHDALFTFDWADVGAGKYEDRRPLGKSSSASRADNPEAVLDRRS
jgi:hypothetical protein